MASEKKSKTKSSGRRKQTPKKKVPDKNMRPKELLIGICLIVAGLIGAYAYISFSAGVLGDSISFVLSYLFGVATIIICCYLVLLGVVLTLHKWEFWKSTFLLSIILLINFMILFTVNAPNLTDYSVAELFSLAKYGQYGGIIGILLARVLILLLAKKGTFLLVIVVSILVLMIIFKEVLKKYLQKFKTWRENGPTVGQMTKNKIADKKEQQRIRSEAKATKNRTSETTFIPPVNEYGEATHLFDPIDDEMLDEARDFDALSFDIPNEKPQKGLFEPVTQVSKKPKTKDPFGFDEEEKAIKTDKTQISTAFEPIEVKGREASNPSELLKAVEGKKAYHFPELELLNSPVAKKKTKKDDVLKKARTIERTLDNFGVKAKIIEVNVGPSITRFELALDPGVKVNKFVNLSNDLALALATSDIRIEAPIPGKAAVGIEVPNDVAEVVGIREIIDSKAFKSARSPLTFALGKTLSGEGVIGDIGKMPHVLIAGATGSGKSVCINSIIISLLYKSSPDDLRFIMIDPKMVELNQYNSIPHLLIPVVTDPKKAAHALNWGLKEMTDRYSIFKEAGVRDIEGYNAHLSGREKLPRIVIVIDELADLMITSPKECENAICRIAQLARACGIHLVIATQRPSVDVITGLIKANIPSRIAFAVASNTDSRTILDTGGAEKLLGKGDMLYFPVGQSKPTRVQCTYVSDDEINRIIDAIKQPEVQFDAAIEEALEVEPLDEKKPEKAGDVLTEEAMNIAFEYKQISTSMIQRKLQVGYARAGRIIDELEERGLISGPNGSKPRQILVDEADYRRG
ncbi:MAG: segregation ATPase FtsK/SpoIIIE, family [Eubacteriaceae bacterium]|jgi:S-DNA-T family DNA segregation ATPase FtsK/SpoIIIE|nr:segregation ATPase FtsK/SpoIIIE, family [Eubacteriaceae bacterium]MDK2935193.1 segregation ATPase FtsK/SpoIIIE, family [Eubacteriaceae bacterium]